MKKYGDLDTLNKVWRRYSFTRWEQVKPTDNLGPFPDAIDWVKYRIENAHELLKWRISIIRSADPDHLISCHGAKKDEPLSSLPAVGNDPWRAGALVDVFGSTGGHSYYRNDGNWLAWMHTTLLVEVPTENRSGGRVKLR